MLKGAVVGCGFFADNHLNAWGAIDGAEIVAVCDRDPARLKRAVETFGIVRTYTDIDEMLATETLDFVDVATGPGTHEALVAKVAAAGKAVICQKPIAQTIEGAKDMVAACEKAGVTFMIHENFRWQKPLMAVKAAIDAGRIGTPYFGRISFRTDHDIYAGQPYLATEERFIVADLGIHVLDMARYYFGEVESLAASTTRVNPKIRGEDVATMMLKHDSGVTSVVDCTYASPRPEDVFPETLVEIDGSEGSIKLDGHYRLTVFTRGGAAEVTNVDAALLPWAEKPWHVVQDSVLAIQQDFVRCLEEGREPATSGRDNLKTYSLVDAVYRSAEGPLTRVEPER
ncbi:MAG: Gfo/Idh/MocA family oxidoreductase [Acuticoccus sp.]